jgi:hypothetical protein
MAITCSSRIISLTFCLFVRVYLFGQQGENVRSLFIQSEYQFFQYNYLSFGLGYQPSNSLFHLTRVDPEFTFHGFTFNYTKKLNNSDWGTSVQSVCYTGTELLGVGIEGSYRSVNYTNHFCFKPMIGFSVFFGTLMWGYNFDFYRLKSQRISQSELSLGGRIPILREKHKGISLQ